MILYTECNFFFPDPAAAISATQILAKILKVKIDTTEIQKSVDALRLQNRQLMQETLQRLRQGEGEGQPHVPTPHIYG